MVTNPVELYTDGSAITNPGVGGYAYVIKYLWSDDVNTPPTEKLIEFKQGYRMSTNNRMELSAIINGLRAIIDASKNGTLTGTTQVNVYSDSEMCVNAVNKGWLRRWIANDWVKPAFQDRPAAPVKNRDLWEEFVKVEAELHIAGINYTLNWVQGHAGNPLNERVDQLAREATGPNIPLLVDEGFETAQRERRDNRFSGGNRWGNNNNNYSNNYNNSNAPDTQQGGMNP